MAPTGSYRYEDFGSSVMSRKGTIGRPQVYGFVVDYPTIQNKDRKSTAHYDVMSYETLGSRGTRPYDSAEKKSSILTLFNDRHSFINSEQLAGLPGKIMQIGMEWICS